MILKLLLNTRIIWMIFEKIEEYTPNKKRKILIVFDDMIAYMLGNKKFNPVVTELFITGKKLKISFVFITKSYFSVTNNIKLNSMHHFIMKIPNKREIAFNHSSDIDFKEVINILFYQILAYTISSMFCSYLAQLSAYTLFSHQNINFKKYQCNF